MSATLGTRPLTLTVPSTARAEVRRTPKATMESMSSTFSSW